VVDAQAAAELARDAEPVEVGGDLRARPPCTTTTWTPA
jgi:hypothetical protein